ncbi:sugar ABC transporter substrate-binding protein [Bacillus solimangrovi]|uniref:LacI family transcriptional regulator n=1 Tax=Bacillus solimangrovi TaxID=1305675 RepID=A0A1E5LE60_9BACI|nr:sugar ABC transporter substrate-binding protein [Bacillus solimangrovi]OEH92375.1 LacI family transcriptional regulator [Bacillus solimangrovi]
MKKNLSKLFILLLALNIFLIGCTNEQDAVSSQPADEPTEQVDVINEDTNKNTSTATIPEAVNKPLKIAAIMQMSIGTFSSQYVAGVKEQVEKFGGEVQIYNSNNDLAQMATHLDTAVNQGVDGILIDHGRADALEAGVKKAIEAGIPVVVFDNDIDLPGVTKIDQDDYSLAWDSLKTLAQDIDGEGNIVYIWVGGFTPMERRNVIYEAFKTRYPAIQEIARFGTASANTALDTQTQMEAILKQYPKGEIDAVFAPWDEFAKGAVRAIEQAGRDEISVYGIDLSDEDLQIIQKENSAWKASAATDPAEVGKIQVRFLYQKIAGEPTPQIFSLDPYLVKQTDLPKQNISMDEIGDYIDGWGESNAATSAWMEQLEQQVKE